ncbi:phospho-sugar mutase [Massiliimalia massiliensis]|uniref:phospho-sugar mutase n=1 Tax=Massiliimalia massiliensis TaxID=1852384 RepID=UPI0009861DCB|nr:phospho-sugar mutase [Massiliimalia massiliensis]
MLEMELYKRWVSQDLEDSDLKEELAAITDDVESIKDRFYKDLEFGTAGLRGVIGAGTNRMNIYVIRRATQGFADYINAKYDHGTVAIGYDSRIKSDVFAKETACVLAANGIKAYIYKELMPVPCLSFAVRHLKCSAGVMVTASHNPAKYNGYKVYGDDGCQITLEGANQVLENIGKVDIFDGVKLMAYEEAKSAGMIEVISDDVLEAFLDAIQKQSINKDVVKEAGLKVVYTPLNGAGNKPVRAILERIGIQNVVVVPEQEKPDGTFPTCPFPNPEIAEALDLGLKLCKREKADLLLATDPDCDRVGIAVPNHDGEYVLITGNEVGAMLMEYICSQRIAKGIMPKDPVAVSTIVSTAIAQKIAEHYGVEFRQVLTGFKFIGEQIYGLEELGHPERYIFGFEESYGYLIGTHARDKDAVVASMMICEMAAYLRSKGITVLEYLDEIYKTYGFYYHTQQSFTCEGAAGMERMNEIMANLQQNVPTQIGGLKVLRVDNYITGESTDMLTGNREKLTLPNSAVLFYHLEDEASVCIRPSGTEPKIKAYYTTVKDVREDAYALDRVLKEDLTRILGF